MQARNRTAPISLNAGPPERGGPEASARSGDDEGRRVRRGEPPRGDGSRDLEDSISPGPAGSTGLCGSRGGGRRRVPGGSGAGRDHCRGITAAVGAPFVELPSLSLVPKERMIPPPEDRRPVPLPVKLDSLIRAVAVPSERSPALLLNEEIERARKSAGERVAPTAAKPSLVLLKA